MALVTSRVKDGNTEWYPSNYLHYRYANFKNPNLLTSYYAHKDTLIFKPMMKEFGKRVAKNVSQSGVTEASALVDALFSAEGKAILEQALSPKNAKQKTTSSAATSKVDGLSYGQIKSRKVFMEAGRDLVNDVANFQSGLRALIEEIAATMGASAYKDLEDAVLLEAARGDVSAARGTKAKQRILAEIYDHNNQFLSAKQSSQAELNKSMKKLISIAYALSSADGGPVTSVRRVSESKVLQTVADKTAGWLNHSSGVMEEIANAACLDKLNREAMKKLGVATGILSASASGTTPITVVPGADYENAARYASEEPAVIKVQKEDASFTLTDNEATFSSGISVKKYTTKSGQKTVHVSLNSNSPFLASLGYSGLLQDTAFMGAMMNAAGGRPGKGKNGSASEGQIQKQWTAARDIASLAAFLHNLAGTGADEDNVVMLIVNRKIYTVPELIKRVMQDPSLVTGTKLGRGPMMRENTLVNKGTLNRLDALERSNAAQKAIIGIWQNAKVTAGLKMSL